MLEQPKIFRACCVLIIISVVCLSPALPAVQKTKTNDTVPVALLTRTTTRHESQHFGYGGTVTVVGAPNGSINIEGWQRSEVEVTAEIELQAPTEQDLALLASVNSVVFNDDTNHISVLTTGTHDRAFMKRAAKEFPKRLLNLPWKVDYKIHVPVSTDVEINAGRGPLNLSGVEGAIRLNATESESILTFTGGIVSATIASGNVRVIIPVRSWRGGGAEIRIAAGVLNIDLPAGFNGDINADILRSGKIVSSYDELQLREKPGITERVVRARAGAGGPFFNFIVGDGTININKRGS